MKIINLQIARIAIMALALVSCCFMGYWLRKSTEPLDTHDVMLFEENKHLFQKYVDNSIGDHGKPVSPFSSRLHQIGIAEITEKESYIQFRIKSDGFDDPSCLIIYNKTPSDNFINAMLQNEKAPKTFNMQYLSQPRWYYWKHD